MAASGAWGGGIGLAIEVEPNSALRVVAGANGSDGLVELITPSKDKQILTWHVMCKCIKENLVVLSLNKYTGICSEGL